MMTKHRENHLMDIAIDDKDRKQIAEGLKRREGSFAK